jgi:hypothetical protein
MRKTASVFGSPILLRPRRARPIRWAPPLNVPARCVFMAFWLGTCLPASDIPFELGCDPPDNPPPECRIFPQIFAEPARFGTVIFENGTGTLTGFNSTGSGTFFDPWLMNLQVAGPNVALRFTGDLTGGTRFGGAFFSTILTNTGPTAWTGLDVEVQSVLGMKSDDSDGLGLRGPRGLPSDPPPMFSDIFTQFINTLEERDAVTYSGGIVAPGVSVAVVYGITDNRRDDPDFSANHEFYVVLTPTEVPESSSLHLMGVGFGALVCLRCRMRRTLIAKGQRRAEDL